MEFFSSIPSRNMQKKEKRPRSKSIPKAVPISRDIGAVFDCSPDERVYAVASNPMTIRSEMRVRTFSALFHSGVTAPDVPRPLLCN